MKRTSARRECSNSFKHLPPNAVPPPAATSGGVLASGLAAPRARRSGTVARGGRLRGTPPATGASTAWQLRRRSGLRARVTSPRGDECGGRRQGTRRRQGAPERGLDAEAEDEEVAGRVVEKKEARGIGSHLLGRADPTWSADLACQASKSGKYVVKS